MSSTPNYSRNSTGSILTRRTTPSYRRLSRLSCNSVPVAARNQHNSSDIDHKDPLQLEAKLRPARDLQSRTPWRELRSDHTKGCSCSSFSFLPTVSSQVDANVRS